MEKLEKIQAHWLIRVIEFITLYFVSLLIILYYTRHNKIERIYLYLIVTVLLIFISSLINYFRAKSKYNSYGLNFDRFTIIHIIQGFVLVLLPMLLILIISYILNAQITINPISAVQYFSFALFTFQIFLSASSEELIFRGILFQAISQKFGDIFAALFLSLIFTLFHINNPNVNSIALINIFLAGIFFSACYIKTKSLWLGISFHFLWNWSEFILIGSPISGLEFYIKPLFEIKLQLLSNFNQFLLGGKFGIEEGLFTTIILLVLTFLVLKLAKYSPYVSSNLLKMEYAESKYITK